MCIFYSNNIDNSFLYLVNEFVLDFFYFSLVLLWIVIFNVCFYIILTSTNYSRSCYYIVFIVHVKYKLIFHGFSIHSETEFCYIEVYLERNITDFPSLQIKCALNWNQI